MICGGKDRRCQGARRVSLCCAVEKKENGNIDGEGWKYGTRKWHQRSLAAALLVSHAGASGVTLFKMCKSCNTKPRYSRSGGATTETPGMLLRFTLQLQTIYKSRAWSWEPTSEVRYVVLEFEMYELSFF